MLCKAGVSWVTFFSCYYKKDAVFRQNLPRKTWKRVSAPVAGAPGHFCEVPGPGAHSETSPSPRSACGSPGLLHGQTHPPTPKNWMMTLLGAWSYGLPLASYHTQHGSSREAAGAHSWMPIRAKSLASGRVWRPAHPLLRNLSPASNAISQAA